MSHLTLLLTHRANEWSTMSILDVDGQPMEGFGALRSPLDVATALMLLADAPGTGDLPAHIEMREAPADSQGTL